MESTACNWYYCEYFGFSFVYTQRAMAFKSIPNEALLQTSFSILFSEKINIGLPLFLTTIYRFFGLWLLTTGSIIICYVYVTRLGTKVARNSIFFVIIFTLIAIYYLIFSYLPSSALKPILHFLTLCLFLSVFCSKYLPD